MNKSAKTKFPTLATILLVIGLLWILSDTMILTINIPWIPLIIVIIAIGMIVNRYGENKR
jgi:hypothetical protein